MIHAMPAEAQIEAALRKMLEARLIASRDDASIYAKDDRIRSNQGAPGSWVVSFFERSGISALAFIRPASPLREILRDLARGGAPILSSPKGDPSRRFPDIMVVRNGSTASLEQALLDRNCCLVRGTGPDGDELSITACSTLSLHDALAKIQRIAQDFRGRDGVSAD